IGATAILGLRVTVGLAPVREVVRVETRDELGDIDLERCSDLHKGRDRGVADTALDALKVGQVHVGALREHARADARCSAELLNAPSHFAGDLRLCLDHSLMVAATRFTRLSVYTRVLMNGLLCPLVKRARARRQ